jgi:tRNA(Ile)-lysidine synthase
LLDVLRRLKRVVGFELGAIHVNHQISFNASNWAEFCGQLCTAWRVPLIQRRVSVAGQRDTGLEAAARAARYREFAAVDADVLALGHHRDDQAETVLLNLLRGSGMRGIGGMPPVRPLAAGGPLLLRPLLGLSRDELQCYARDQNLCWVDDESNQDTSLRRNFVRHRVLPLLDEGFPGCRRALARAAQWAAESSMLLDELAASDASAALDSEGRLNLAGLRELSPERGRNLLRHWLRLAGLRMPDSGRLAVIAAQLDAAFNGQRIRIELEGGAIRSYRGWASIEPTYVRPVRQDVIWRGESNLAWGDGRVVLRPCLGEAISRNALASGTVLFRSRQGGERMQLDESRPRRTLKNLCQEAGIAPWLRPAMPLLWCGEDLVWVPGVGISWQYRCAAGDSGLAPSWEQGCSPDGLRRTLE